MKTLFKCPKCGGTNILVKEWRNVNNGKFAGFCDDDEYWCEDCGGMYKHVDTEELKEIQLHNRCGEKNYLLKIAPNQYKLITQFKHCRVGLTDKNDEYSFVDPSGGPFMEVGKIIPEVNKELIKIKEIDGDIILTFKNL